MADWYPRKTLALYIYPGEPGPAPSADWCPPSEELSFWTPETGWRMRETDPAGNPMCMSETSPHFVGSFSIYGPVKYAGIVTTRLHLGYVGATFITYRHAPYSIPIKIELPYLYYPGFVCIFGGDVPPYYPHRMWNTTSGYETLAIVFDRKIVVYLEKEQVKVGVKSVFFTRRFPFVLGYTLTSVPPMVERQLWRMVSKLQNDSGEADVKFITPQGESKSPKIVY